MINQPTYINTFLLQHNGIKIEQTQGRLLIELLEKEKTIIGYSKIGNVLSHRDYFQLIDFCDNSYQYFYIPIYLHLVLSQ